MASLLKETPPDYNEINQGYSPPTYQQPAQPQELPQEVNPNALPQGGYPEKSPQTPYPAAQPYPAQPQGAYPAQPQGAYPAQPQGAYPGQPYQAGPPAYSQPPYPAHPQGVYPSPPVVQQQQQTNVVVVNTQSQAVQPVSIGFKPPNYIRWSVINMIFFCQIFGIIALMYSLRVDSAWARGDVDAAQRSSRFAKNWNVAAFVFGIVLVGIIVVAVVVSRVT